MVSPLGTPPSKKVETLVRKHMLEVHHSPTGKEQEGYDERSAHTLYLLELERRNQELKFPTDVSRH